MEKSSLRNSRDRTPHAHIKAKNQTLDFIQAMRFKVAAALQNKVSRGKRSVMREWRRSLDFASLLPNFQQRIVQTSASKTPNFLATWFLASRSPYPGSRPELPKQATPELFLDLRPHSELLPPSLMRVLSTIH